MRVWRKIKGTTVGYTRGGGGGGIVDRSGRAHFALYGAREMPRPKAIAGGQRTFGKQFTSDCDSLTVALSVLNESKKKIGILHSLGIKRL